MLLWDWKWLIENIWQRAFHVVKNLSKKEPRPIGFAHSRNVRYLLYKLGVWTLRRTMITGVRIRRTTISAVSFPRPCVNLSAASGSERGLLSRSCQTASRPPALQQLSWHHRPSDSIVLISLPPIQFLFIALFTIGTQYATDKTVDQAVYMGARRTLALTFVWILCTSRESGLVGQVRFFTACFVLRKI